MKKPIDLSYTPLIAPLIVIEKATYGMTKEGINEKVRLALKEVEFRYQG